MRQIDVFATKQRLGHGRFGEWIQAEFDMGRQTATNLMNVAEKFGSEFPKIGNLTPSILYQLAAITSVTGCRDRQSDPASLRCAQKFSHLMPDTPQLYDQPVKHLRT